MQFELRCCECHATFEESPSRLVCSHCSNFQEPGGPTRGVLEVVLAKVAGEWPQAALDSYQFLSTFLPLASEENLPPLPVGATPLLAAKRLAAELGVRELWIKDDTRNPSGSTKDRASLLVVAKAAQYEFDTIAAASSGNAATALAAVTAASGHRSICFVPESTPPAKLTQIACYGAVLLPVRGSYDEAFELCCAACEEFGWYNRNTALNPYTIEGKKTAALEIARQMAPQVPDVVVVPVGDGVIVAGVAKGFSDLLKGGLIDRTPRIIAAQAERSAGIAEALSEGWQQLTGVAADSVADSLNVQIPRNTIQSIGAVQASGGTAVLANDEEILDAIHSLASRAGVFAEPAAAASLAALKNALHSGVVKPDETVVLLVTGSGLKDVQAAARAIPIPEPIDPDLESVRGRLAESEESP